MADKPVLYGFDGSTYVRTVKIVLAEKGLDYDQVQINVLKGEPHQPEHLARHPFGKVPVLDIDGMRLLETDAICRYLDAAYPGTQVVPTGARDIARCAMAMNLIESYGYPNLLPAAGYHLFPDFIGGKNDEAHAQQLANGETVLKLLMETKGEDPWLAGANPSIADFLLGPILFYSSLTPDFARISAVPGVAEWWQRISAWPTFQSTEPDLG